MAGVVPASLERADASLQARDRHQGRVEDRHTHHDDRHEKCDVGRSVELQLEAEVGEHEAEEQRARVTHVDGARDGSCGEETRARSQRDRWQSVATRNWPFEAAMTKIDPAAIAATPDDSPSMLSRRLNAFVIPTTHTTVTSKSVRVRPGEIDTGAHGPDSDPGTHLGDEPHGRGSAPQVVEQADDGEPTRDQG